MKIVYEKPAIVFERFIPSQSISSGCEAIATFGEGGCPVLYKTDGIASIPLFHGSKENCQWVPDNPDDYICYHAPSEMNNVFSS